MTTPAVKVIIGNTNLSKEDQRVAKAAILTTVKALVPNNNKSKNKSKSSQRKRARNNNNNDDVDEEDQEKDDLELLASRIIVNYNSIREQYKGRGTEWQPWHCFVGTDLVFAVRPRSYFMAEITGGSVLKKKNLSIFCFRSATTSSQNDLRKKSKSQQPVALHDVEHDPDHMDRTTITKVRTDMDDIMYNSFEDVCRITIAKKYVTSLYLLFSSSSSSSSSSFHNTFIYYPVV